jgi:hypothetical protein
MRNEDLILSGVFHKVSLEVREPTHDFKVKVFSTVEESNSISCNVM